MKMYTCPMHPGILVSKPGKCPHCEMDLVVSTSSTNFKKYTPLWVIISLILLFTIVLSIRDALHDVFTFSNAISYFMIGFFITFAGFKLMDLQGFATGYANYDLLAKKIFGYGYVYPFIELFFGVAMIFSHAIWLLWAEIIIMTLSGIGVFIKLQRKETFHCACLGTFLKVPLTTVTLVEDFGMAVLAALLLVLQ